MPGLVIVSKIEISSSSMSFLNNVFEIAVSSGLTFVFDFLSSSFGGIRSYENDPFNSVHVTSSLMINSATLSFGLNNITFVIFFLNSVIPRSADFLLNSFSLGIS